MQVTTRSRETRHFADGGLVKMIKEKVFGSPETVTQKYARQDAERAARSPAAAAMAAPPAATQHKAISDYAGMGAMQRREAAAGMKDGGPVKGPGTGTSDSIPRNVRPGSFIMPADSTKKVPVMLSNGEHEFTPEQVHGVGVAVLSAMKDATHKPTGKGKTKHGKPAHADGDEVKKPLDAQAASDRRSAAGAVRTFSDMNTRAGAAIADVATMPLRGLAGAYDTAVVRPMRAAGVNAAYTSPMVSPAGADPASQTPFYDQLRRSDAVGAGRGTVNPAPANPMAAMPTVQTTTSAAGAGRGSVNPSPTVIDPGAGAGRGTVNPARVGTVAPDDLSGPRLSGAVGSTAGMPVDGAAGVRKFVTQDGRTLYSNVAGAADNNKLMSNNPGVSVMPAMGGLDPGRDMSPKAIMERATAIYQSMNAGNAPNLMGASAPTGRYFGAGGPISARNMTAADNLAARYSGAAKAQYDQEVADAAATNAAGGFHTGQPQTPRSMLMGQLSGKRLTGRGARVLSDLAQSDATASNNAATQSLAAQRLALDTTTAAQDAPLKASQVKTAQDMQSAQDAYTKALAGGDAKEIARTENALRARQGRYERETPPSWEKIQTGVDDKTGAPIYQLYDKRSGPASMGAQAPALPPGMVKQIGTANGKPVYEDKNGKQFGG